MLHNLGKVKVVFSAEDLAGQGFKSADELKSIRERFQDGVTSLFILTPPNPQETFTPEQLCIIRKWYSFERTAGTKILSGSSTFDFKIPKRVVNDDNSTKLVFNNFLNLDCQNKKLLATYEEIRTSLNNSPFGLAREATESVSLLFQFTFENSTSSKFGSFDPVLFDQLHESFNENLAPLIQGIKISWMGPGDYQWYVWQGFKFAKFTNIAMAILIILGFRFFLGTWKSGIIFVVKLVVSAIWLFGLKGLIGSSFDVLSTGLFLLLGISALEDYVFTSHDQFQSGSWKKSTLKYVVPGFYTSLTTILGFISLGGSDVESVQRMGIWAAVGALIEWMMVFLVLPSFYQQFKNLKTIVSPKRAKLQTFLSHSIFKSLPKKICLISLMVYPLGLIFMNNFDYNQAPHKVFPKDQEYSLGIEQMNKNKGWLGNVSLLFDASSDVETKKSLIEKILQSPEGKKHIIKYESPWNIPEWMEQYGNISELEANTYFKISRLYKQYVDEEGNPRAMFYIKDPSSKPVQQLKAEVNKICGDKCHLGGEIVAYSDFTDVVPKTLVESLITSLFMVSLIICFVAIALGKPNLIPSLLLSAYWSPFFVIMLMGMLHLNIDFWQSIFASILVGTAGDNAIHYLFGAEHQELGESIDEKGVASIITATLMACVSLVYLGSYFSSPKIFGLVLFTGLFASLFGELWLLKGFVELTSLFKFKSWLRLK